MNLPRLLILVPLKVYLQIEAFIEVEIQRGLPVFKRRLALPLLDRLFCVLDSELSDILIDIILNEVLVMAPFL